MRAGGMRYILEKLSRKTTSLLWTSSQLEVWTKSYDFAKSQESKPGQFQDFSLGVPRQKAIRMWVLRRGTNYTIWGKVVASPEFRPWWVMWVQSLLKYYTNFFWWECEHTQLHTIHVGPCNCIHLGSYSHLPSIHFVAFSQTQQPHHQWIQ